MFRAARVVGAKISTNRATVGKVVTGVALTGAGFATFAANATQPSICDADYGKLRKEIEAMVDADDEKRENGTSMAGNFANTIAIIDQNCAIQEFTFIDISFLQILNKINLVLNYSMICSF